MEFTSRLKGLLDRGILAGAFDADSNESLRRYLPQDQIDLIPADKRDQFAQMAFRANREEGYGAAQKRLLEFAAMPAAQARLADVSKILGGGYDPTLEDTVLNAPGNASGAPDFRTAASRLEAARANPPAPPSNRDLLVRRHGQLLARGHLEAADKLSEQIKRVEEEFSAPETVLGTDNKPMQVRFGKYGASQRTGYAPTPNVLEVTVGDSKELVDKNDPRMPTLRKLTGYKIPNSVIEAAIFSGVPLTENMAGLSQSQRDTLRTQAESMATAGATKVGLNTSDPTAVAKAQMDLSRQYAAAIEEDRALAGRYATLTSAMTEAAKGNAQADGAIIYSIAKILDPGAAVQEGDKKTLVGVRNIPEQLRGLFDKHVGGQTLTENERKNLLKVANGIMRARVAAASDRASEYQGYARSLGGDGKYIKSPYGALSIPDDDAVQPVKPAGAQGDLMPGPKRKPVGDYFKG